MTAAGLLWALAGPAAAHSAVPGIGTFYNGMLHPFLTAPHLIALLAGGLFIGQREAARTEAVFFALFGSLAAGLVASLWVGVEADRLLLALSALLGLAIVTVLALPRGVVMLAVAAVGLLVGLGSAPEALTGRGRWIALLGTLLGAALCAGYAAVAAIAARKPVLRIGVRIVGSWLAAAALLVLSLTLVGKTGT